MINYRSGFFRLWVLLSILWFGVVVAIAQPHKAIETLMGEGAIDIEAPDGTIINFPTNTSPETVQQTLVKWFNHNSGSLLDQFVTNVNRQRNLALEDLINFAMGAFYVPAALFAFGVGCAWVIRGFIKRQNLSH